MATGIEGRPRELSALDRCDRCTARATVETVMQGGGALLWCAHHFMSFKSALDDMGAKVTVDIR
jgi:hypothetical protein